MSDLEKYTERQIRWSGIALSQLSFANNFILTLATGFLAFCFNPEQIKKLTFCCCYFCCFSCLTSWFYFLTLLFVVVSIIIGVVVIISRLYDFRITRHVTLVRQRFYSRVTIKLKLNPSEESGKLEAKDFSDSTCSDKCSAFFKAICGNLKYIDMAEIEKIKEESIEVNKKSINDALHEIRKISHSLGELTWCGFKWQVLAFLFSCISFAFYTTCFIFPVVRPILIGL